MENHTIPGLPLGGIADGRLVHFFGPDTPVQLIAVTDIGAFAHLAFTRPQDYIGQAIELAGDELTPRRTVEIISHSLGRTISYRQVPVDDPELGMGGASAFADEKGLWRADIPALRELRPGLLDFETWLRTGGAERIEALLAVS